MAKQRKTKATVEFGDFQTPPSLALTATAVINRLGIRPRSILEPTCGRGAFINAAAAVFPEAESIIGIDINPDHLAAAATFAAEGDRSIELRQGDFFQLDWDSIVTQARAPWLIIGNPPWVTSAALGAINSDNLPHKSNFHGRTGIEAITGKSNFDISEWMLLRYLNWLEDCTGTIAVLCKTAVARKILLHIWKKHYPLRSAQVYKIDAARHFGAAVDACFFVLEIQPGTFATNCAVYDAIDAESPSQTFGFSAGHIIANMTAFSRWHDLFGPEAHYVWRSGIKHDCAKVMELALVEDSYRNGLGETVGMEATLLFPLLKSSDIGNEPDLPHRSMMLVTQQFIGQDTTRIASLAPRTWGYLHRHANLLGQRGSTIYKAKAPFSIFGVGPYSFAPWKVAISGLYKRLQFVKVGPVNDRPVVFDDTVYFLPCWSEEEACFLEDLLRSAAANEFLQSMIHWEDKRPITIDILKRLSIGNLATLLGREQEYSRFTAPKGPLLA